MTTWQTLSLTTILGSGWNFINAEIRFTHNTFLSLFGGYVDDAVLTAVAPVVDADGDGVPDDSDACANSILSSTVTIAGSDTGVPNTIDAQGCTVADRLESACSGDFRNHGQFVSCVSNAVEDAIFDGLITDDEGEAIVSVAARSSVGKPANAGKKK